MLNFSIQTYADWGVDYLKEDSCYASQDHNVCISRIFFFLCVFVVYFHLKKKKNLLPPSLTSTSYNRKLLLNMGQCVMLLMPLVGRFISPCVGGIHGMGNYLFSSHFLLLNIVSGMHLKDKVWVIVGESQMTAQVS
jgi:hypothetical protein